MHKCRPSRGCCQGRRAASALRAPAWRCRAPAHCGPGCEPAASQVSPGCGPHPCRKDPGGSRFGVRNFLATNMATNMWTCRWRIDRVGNAGQFVCSIVIVVRTCPSTASPVQFDRSCSHIVRPSCNRSWSYIIQSIVVVYFSIDRGRI